MGKRTVLILCICVMALSCVWADSSIGGVVDVSIMPSSSQMIKVGDDIYKSTSGFGATAGYMRNVWEGLSVGAGFEWTNFVQEKLQNYGALNNIAVLARCSYKFGLSEKVFADAGLGLGYEMCIVGDNVSGSFVLELGGNIGIIIDDVFSLLAGVRTKASFQKATKAYSVLPTVGAGITL